MRGIIPTLVGKRGIRLSSGDHRQHIGIARAL